MVDNIDGGFLFLLFAFLFMALGIIFYNHLASICFKHNSKIAKYKFVNQSYRVIGQSNPDAISNTILL